MRRIDPAAWNRGSTAYGGGGGSRLGRLVNRLVVLAFAVIQAVLVARILLDLGVIPADWGISAGIAGWSDTLAAPVSGLTGGLFDGGATSGLGPSFGDGFNPVMLAALFGWTMVEGLVMGVVRKLASA
jgi:hypothetical protein